MPVIINNITLIIFVHRSLSGFLLIFLGQFPYNWKFPGPDNNIFIALAVYCQIAFWNA